MLRLKLSLYSVKASSVPGIKIKGPTDFKAAPSKSEFTPMLPPEGNNIVL